MCRPPRPGPDARITLLTTQPFEALAKSSPFFNASTPMAGERPHLVAELIMRIRRGGFDRVYDLQNDDRPI